MPGDKILTYTDYLEEPRKVLRTPRTYTYEQFLGFLRADAHGEELPPLVEPLSSIPAYVDKGRWVWVCGGDCGGTSIIVDNKAASICPECVAPEWVRPSFPTNRAEIESYLLRMPGYRLRSPVRDWRLWWPISKLQGRLRRANELRQQRIDPITALSIPSSRDWVAGETATAPLFRQYITEIQRALSGESGVIQLENSLEIANGSGSNYFGLPGGDDTQRPGMPFRGMVRFNTTTNSYEFWNGTRWVDWISATAVTFANLMANGDIGTAADQVPTGNHIHVYTGITSGAAQARTTSSFTASATFTSNLGNYIVVAQGSGDVTSLSFTVGDVSSPSFTDPIVVYSFTGTGMEITVSVRATKASMTTLGNIAFTVIQITTT